MFPPRLWFWADLYIIEIIQNLLINDPIHIHVIPLIICIMLDVMEGRGKVPAIMGAEGEMILPVFPGSALFQVTPYGRDYGIAKMSMAVYCISPLGAYSYELLGTEFEEGRILLIPKRIMS